MPYNWGPNFIVPTDVLESYSGKVLLREDLDKELLRQELSELGVQGSVVQITNPWYFRKKGHNSWIKIGESRDEDGNFPVRWNTTLLENGRYEVMGFMHVYVEKEGIQTVIARSNTVEISIEN
ncbi:hypothetical protein [Desulfonatronospira sp.]|uniref:hypothetical protein n=1 Tax=Desulfonatronospira sp. TaxID=1962951 RepID=UPI0025BA374A|nr:hypothetical protein [Desulfonatronospira sp.]